MFVQTKETPNPNTLKFMPGRTVIADGSMHIDSADEAQGIPLAQDLFQIPEVESVFLAKDFISVTKKMDTDWFVVKADVIATLIDFFSMNEQSITLSPSDTGNLDEEVTYTEETQQIVNEICDLIETKIRPMVAMDGGDIVFSKFVEGRVFVKLQGACSTCPSATATLKSGVENMLRHYVPEVEEVVSL